MAVQLQPNSFEELDLSLLATTNLWNLSAKRKRFEFPKIIHQIWVNEDPELPEHWKVSPEEWKRLHPGWVHVLWNGPLSRALIAKYRPEFLPIYDGFPYEIQRIDAVRYCFLQVYGGMYIDLDTLPLANVEAEFTSNCEVYLVPEQRRDNFTNMFMASKPGCKLWDLTFPAMQEPPESGALTKFYTVLQSTGPDMLARVARRYTGIIGRLPVMKFNTPDSEGMSIEEARAAGSLIKALRGGSWMIGTNPSSVTLVGKSIALLVIRNLTLVRLLVLLVLCYLAYRYFVKNCNCGPPGISILLALIPRVSSRFAS